MAAVRYRLRSLLRSGWRTVLGTALMVAIAGGIALTLLAGALRTLSAPDRYVRSQAEVFDAEVQQQEGAPRGEDLRGLAAAKHVETATFVFGGLIAAGSKGPEDLLVFAGSATALGANVGEGRAPAADRPNEFVIARSFFKAHGFSTLFSENHGRSRGSTIRQMTTLRLAARDYWRERSQSFRRRADAEQFLAQTETDKVRGALGRPGRARGFSSGTGRHDGSPRPPL